ncbi:hypothetical protein [Saccharothrix australiensis]|uniref:Uncharacterized protein n=1 Tax=Saccharothrix australiensis TaxID=2072 RepID=A0A495W0E4_9PSEU|nr:hypothetical protein [Saccharothrix australiensis]RKT54580.1 hypothetical protein C8E97_3224 [Saccharothrix australiensis]
MDAAGQAKAIYDATRKVDEEKLTARSEQARTAAAEAKTAMS